MIVYMDLENLLKEKNISKNKLCEACNLQRTQLNNYCKNKVTRIDFSCNSLIQISHISICFQMHIALIHLV